MRNLTAIYLIAGHPLFNKDAAPEFDKLPFSKSMQFYLSLLRNTSLFIKNSSNVNRYKICLHIDDEETGDQDPPVKGAEIIYLGESDYQKELLTLIEGDSYSFQNQILIHLNTLGIDKGFIERFNDFLNIDNYIFSYVVNNKNKIGAIGFNKFSADIVSRFLEGRCTSDSFLKQVCKEDFLIRRVDGLVKLDKVKDLENLLKDHSESFIADKEIKESLENIIESS